jgi:hypothetical protein
MISLKKFLDALAGPDHPFVKGPKFNNENGLNGSSCEPELFKKGARKKRTRFRPGAPMRFLRMNYN